MNNTIKLSTVLVSLLLSTAAVNADSIGEPGRSTGKANPLKNVYFGEQHLHTQNSFDAYTVGVRQTWAEAYQYAMGEEVKLSTTGKKMQRKTPYDWVAITDHSEYFAVMKGMGDPKNPLSKSSLAKSLDSTNPKQIKEAAVKIISTTLTGIPLKEFVEPSVLKKGWQDYIAVADKYNKPGKFTTIVAYEWTSIPDGQNMHRNVFFKEKPADLPFSSFESIQPEDLWTYMEHLRARGIEVFAIPHNGNVSNGLMYAPTKMNGDRIDARYAQRQNLNEPLTEILQTKGNSETHPLLSPNDEFAKFEQFNNLISLDHPGQVTNSYVRQGLTTGMKIETEVGYNPFKFGIVSGADVHSGYSGSEEWAWNGAHGNQDDTAKKRLDPTPNASGEAGAVVSGSGTTAVWTNENTRAGIWNGLKSKETYGTTGPMIKLRFFSGWDLPKDLTKDKEYVKKSYALGVPMGQDMKKMPSSAKAPSFSVWAQKDPESGNLDRVQVVKGWLNPKTGYHEEKIYDIAWSGDRKIDAKTGKLPAVGSTVDLKKATYTNTIGVNELSTVWTDPDFDPKLKAVYYVRVLEIPTPRWSTYDAARNNLPLSTVVPATIQERAYSSPIWYTPATVQKREEHWYPGIEPATETKQNM